MAATKWFNKDGHIGFLQPIQTFEIFNFSAVQSQPPNTDVQCVSALISVLSSKCTPKPSLNWVSSSSIHPN